MRILVVSAFSAARAVGGAEIVAHRHALELRRRGHEVAVFAGRVHRSDQVGGEFTLENNDGMDVHLVSIRSLDAVVGFHWEAAGRRLRAVLHHFKPDVVHFHNLNGLGVNLILEAKRFGARTVCTVHDHWGFCARNTLLHPNLSICSDHEGCHFCLGEMTDESGKALPLRLRRDYVRWCLSQVDELVFPSRYLRDAYRSEGFDPSNLHYVSNGIDLARFEESLPRDAATPLRMTVVGYLGEHKGLGVLFEAIDRLSADSSLDGRWTLRIAGDGHMRSQVQRLARNPNCAGRVEYLGKVPAAEIPDLLRDTDVIVLPSVWPENEPVVLLEAIATGVAQVASDLGGHPELIEDGRSGFLFKRGSATDLVDKLGTYIRDPELARRHGAYNRARRAGFSEKLAVSSYEAIYAAQSAPRGEPETLVICGGSWPSLDVAQMFNNLSLVEGRRRVRLVYDGWADPVVWAAASAVHIWSDEVPEAMLLRAARLGLPVVAPAGSRAIRFLEAEGRPCLGFGDIAECMAILVKLANGETPPRRAVVGSDGFSDWVAAAISADAYRLAAETPSI